MSVSTRFGKNRGCAMRGLTVVFLAFVTAACQTQTLRGSGPVTIAPNVQVAFQQYLNYENPFVFLVSADGTYSHSIYCPASQQCSDPLYARAQRLCEDRARRPCKVFAEGKNIVWEGPVSYVALGAQPVAALTAKWGNTSSLFVLKIDNTAGDTRTFSGKIQGRSCKGSMDVRAASWRIDCDGDMRAKGSLSKSGNDKWDGLGWSDKSEEVRLFVSGDVRPGGQAAPSSSPSATAESRIMAPEAARDVKVDIAEPTKLIVPRTVDDLIGWLETSRGLTAAKREELRKIADSEPSEALIGGTMSVAEQYGKRARAAADIGRIEQAISDMEKAYELVKESTLVPADDKLKIKRHLAATHGLAGNVDHAITLYREIVEATEGARDWGLEGENLNSKTDLAFFLAGVGDLTPARKYADDAVKISASRKSRVNMNYWRDAFYEFKGKRALAAVLKNTGEPEKAEEIYRAAIEAYSKFEQGKRSIDQILNYIHLADALRRQGKFAEAELFARKAVQIEDGTNTPTFAIGYQGFALFILGQVVAEGGRLEEAEKLVRAHLAHFAAMGFREDSLLPVAAQMSLVEVLALQGKWDAARSESEGLRQVSSKSRLTKAAHRVFFVTPALVEMMTGHEEEARRILETHRETVAAILGKDSYEVAEIDGLLGVAEARMGVVDSGVRRMKRALATLGTADALTPSSQQTSAVRSQRLRIIVEEYLRRATLDNTRHSETSIKHLLDTVRHLQEKESFGSLERFFRQQKTGDTGIDRLLTRRSELEKIFVAKRDQMVSLTTNASIMQGVDEKSGQILAELSQVSRELQSVQAELRAKITRIAGWADAGTPDIDQVRSVLREDEYAVQIFVGDRESYVWGIPRTGRIHFHKIAVDKKPLQDMVKSVRESLTPRSDTLGGIPRFDIRSAHQLYKLVLQPVALAMKEARHVIVVSDDVLGRIPFGILVTQTEELGREDRELFSSYRGVSWLAKNYATSFAPSLTSIYHLRKRAVSRPQRAAFAGFGNPVFRKAEVATGAETRTGRQVAGARAVPARNVSIRAVGRTIDGAGKGGAALTIESLQSLPETEEEIIGIATALGARRGTNSVFVRERASKENVIDAVVGDKKVLAFATHGLVAWDLDGLDQPALALSPSGNTGKEYDGLLTLSEIMKLNVSADWVVLSACNTGSIEARAHEAVANLGNAFMFAGAKSAMVSHWPVESLSAKDLTADIFSGYAADRRLSRAEALRIAQLKMIDGGGLLERQTGKLAASYAHPMFWGAFSVYGDGGR